MASGSARLCWRLEPPCGARRVHARTRLAHEQTHESRADRSDTGQTEESHLAAEVVEQVPGHDGAQRRPYTDGAADDAEREAIAAGVARDVGHHQRKHDADNRRRDAVEHLNGHDREWVGDEGEEYGTDCKRCEA